MRNNLRGGSYVPLLLAILILLELPLFQTLSAGSSNLTSTPNTTTPVVPSVKVYASNPSDPVVRDWQLFTLYPGQYHGVGIYDNSSIYTYDIHQPSRFTYPVNIPVSGTIWIDFGQSGGPSYGTYSGWVDMGDGKHVAFSGADVCHPVKIVYNGTSESFIDSITIDKLPSCPPPNTTTSTTTTLSTTILGSGGEGGGGERGGSGECSVIPSLTLSPNPAGISSNVTATVSGLSNCNDTTVTIKDYLGCFRGATIAKFIANATGGSVIFKAPWAPGIYGYFACIRHKGSTKAILTVINTTTSTSTTTSITTTSTTTSTTSTSTSSTSTTTIPQPLSSVAVIVSNSSVNEGQIESLREIIVGGTSPYTYNFMVTNSINGNVIAKTIANSPETTNSFAFIVPSTSDALGVLDVNVIIQDAVNSVATSTNTFKVNPGLSLTSILITPASPSIDNGQSILLSANVVNVVGGTTPYTYQWYEGTNATCTSDSAISGATAATYSASPSANTYYCIKVVDSASIPETQYSATDLVTVNPVFQLTGFSASNAIVVVGQTETLTANVVGGTSPYTYNFVVYNSSNDLVANTIQISPLNSSSFPFTILQSFGPGNFTADVYVTDNSYIPETVSDPLHFIVMPSITGIPSNVTIYVGGQAAEFNGFINGGASPFTGNWAYYPPGSNALAGNTVAASLTSNSIQLSVNAVSESMLVIEFNFVDYDVPAIGTNTILGTWAFNGLIIDKAGHTANTFGTPQITVSSPIGTVSASNSIADQSQFELLTGKVIGGIPQYTYDFIVSNTVNGNTIINALVISSLQNATFSFQIPQTTDALGTLNVNLKVVDSDTPNSIISSNALISVKAQPSVTLTPNATTLTQGKAVTYNAVITGGYGPFVANLIAIANGTVLDTQTVPASGALSFNSFVPPLGTDSYKVIVTDEGTTTPFVFNSINSAISVQSASHGGGIQSSGGGIIQSGGGFIGGGTHKPTLLKYINGNQTGYEILNFSEYDSMKLTYNNTMNITVLENFIEPSKAGITINGNSFTLYPHIPSQFQNSTNYTYFADIDNISYLPILHTITLLVYRQPVITAKPSVTTTSTIPTTIVSTIHTTINATKSSTAAPSNLGALLPWIGEGVAVAIAIAIGLAYPGMRKKKKQ